MPWTLVQADGTAATEAVDLAFVKQRLASGEHFWLDIGHPSPEDLDELGQLLELHPLARDDLGSSACARRPTTTRGTP